MVHADNASARCCGSDCPWMAGIRIAENEFSEHSKMKPNKPKFRIYRFLHQGHWEWLAEHPHGGTMFFHNFDNALLWVSRMIISMQKEKK